MADIIFPQYDHLLLLTLFGLLAILVLGLAFFIGSGCRSIMLWRCAGGR